MSQTSLPMQPMTEEPSTVNLAPIDKGTRAWTFVVCAFVLETLIWGFPFSFGVFQQYYIETNFGNASESTINAIGTIAVAFQYMELPFVIALAQKRPQWIRLASWIALGTCSLSLFLSSFATEAWHLVLLQGVIVGICGGILYAPIVIWVNYSSPLTEKIVLLIRTRKLSEWFVMRRSLAAAIIFGGSGIGGAVFPLLINYLLDHTGGFRWSLRVLAIVVGVCGAAAMTGVKPRVPIVPHTRRSTTTSVNTLGDYKFLKTPLFIVMSVTTMTQALAYFPVSLYIPSYTSAVGLTTLDGTIALAMFNAARVIGQVIFGHICDKTAYTHVVIFSGVGSALAAYLMWGFARTLPVLFAFVIVFGGVSGGFSSVNTPASVDIVGTGSQSGMVYGCFCVFKGVAVIIGPLVSAALHDSASKAPAQYGGYGFTSVELFVGSMMVATSFGGLASMMIRLRR